MSLQSAWMTPSYGGSSIGDDVTTLMIRGVPPEYSQDRLAAEIQHMFGGIDTFDFLYLPWDSTRNRNCGFAFINFTENMYAKQCNQLLFNYCFGGGDKMCIVVPARNQGLGINVRSLLRRMLTGVVKNTPIFVSRGRNVDMGKLAESCQWFNSDPSDAEIVSCLASSMARPRTTARIVWDDARCIHSVRQAYQCDSKAQEFTVLWPKATAMFQNKYNDHVSVQVIRLPDPDAALWKDFVAQLRSSGHYV